MFWNYQHNPRGGWNGMPFNGFNQGQFNYHNQFPHMYPPHQPFGRPIPIVFLPPPHYQYFHHAYNHYPPHQVLRPIVPTVVPPLPHTQGKNGNPPHKAPRTTIPAAISPHQTPKSTIPAKVSPHKMIEPIIPAATPPHQTPKPTIPAKVSPDKTLEPTIPEVVPVQQLPANLVCEICDIPLPRKELEGHKKGKRHRRKVQEQIEYLKRQKSSNGHKATPNSEVSPVVQPKEVPKSKKKGCQVEHVSFKGSFFNSKYKEGSVKGSERKQEDDIGAKDWSFEVETVSPIFKSKNVPTEGSERKPLDNAGAKDRGFKRKIGEAKVAEGKYMKMNNEIRMPMKSLKPEVNALSISVKSLVQAPELTPYSKGKEHNEIQNPIEEKNDQNQSTPMELRASVVSNVSSGTKNMSCNFAAVAVAQPETRDIQIEMLEGKDHNEIQCKAMVSNDLRQSIAVHAPAGSNINSQTEVLNSDSPAIAIELQSFTQSDAIACCKSQDPAKETDFQTLPSVLMELDVPSGATTNTQTVGVSYKDEAKMNVLATELGTTQLSQVSVCLKCGDEGFKEALVYCTKCQIYALHRYCLDGPVVINDDVIWFCVDCEETVADTSSQHQCNLLPFETSDHENSAKETNKQQNQHIAAEEKESKKDSQQFPESKADSDEGCVINFESQPIPDPIWRGSLHLSNQSFGTVDGLLAHVSSLACSKVLEEARLFPQVLCANLLQRSTVWPKGFIEFGTDHQSIALYFFPENERSVERIFDKLVEDMISKDLAISTMVENAELLIFPSTVLPIQYKRFQKKYYLWGVFKAKEASPKTDDVVSEEDTSSLINDSPSNTFGTSGSNGSSCASNH